MAHSNVPTYRPWLHRFTILVGAATVFLIFVGGLVTTTASGDSVPDWWFLPLSFGTLFPSMQGGVFFEHGHRIVASSVGVLTIVLTAWVFARDPRRSARWLAAVALAVVVLQGILGGFRVLGFLPRAGAAIVHACIAQVFFSLLAALAVITSRRWLAARHQPLPPGCRTPALLATGACFVQLVLGAVARHTGYGLDLHVMGAGVVAFIVIWAAVKADSFILGSLLATQLVLGAGTWLLVTGGFERTPQAAASHIILVSSHLAVGALLLAVSLATALRAFRRVGEPAPDAGTAAERTLLTSGSAAP